MAKHIGLVLSSVVAGTLTLAATASAQVPEAAQLWDDTHHVFWMYEQAVALYGVDGTSFAQDPNSPERNRWAGTVNNNPEPCSITWIDLFDYNVVPSAVTKGSCFLTLGIRRANPLLTSSWMFKTWGSSSPTAAKYHDLIVDENRFWNITSALDVGVGDVLATKYGANDSGYTMVVVGIEGTSMWDRGTLNPSDDLLRIHLQVVDSTTTPHWNEDTRWGTDPRHPTLVNNPTGDPPQITVNQDQGVGYGYLFLTVDPATGGIHGHSWSNQAMAGSDYHENNSTGRPIVAGRLDVSKLANP